MTDKELLEYAAKAAGIEVDYSILFAGGVVSWNQLKSDGDALRLAVKLGISILPPENEEEEASCEKNGAWFNEDPTGDPCAATRRAIVRAAAEIGRAMK